MFFLFYLKDLNSFKNPILNSLGLQELQFSRKYLLFRIDDLYVQPYSKNGLQGLISYSYSCICGDKYGRKFGPILHDVSLIRFQSMKTESLEKLHAS